MPFNSSISVVGLGYVGLPLAIHLAKHFQVIGFDISKPRIEELLNGHDRTEEIDSSTLRSSTLHITDAAKSIADSTIHIITVPTPVDAQNQPDLKPVIAATNTVAPFVKKGDIVVYESTVYPGVTEDICGPILQEKSGLVCGEDFFLGYSPERINPGDKVHTVDKITKIVAGQTPEVAEKLRAVYGTMNSDNIFVAANIKTAEAAKVIENAQRDINIAFVNEIAMIFNKMGLSTHDVLEAAGTKWNFLNFTPGLVGGHCIGVDPYYLSHCAEKLGINPQIILSGRDTNENMARKTAEAIESARALRQGSNTPRTLILGLTFKENVPDLRNSKIPDLIANLQELGHAVDVHDPMADPAESKEFYGIDILTSLDPETRTEGGYNCIIAAVPHEGYRSMSAQSLQQLAQPAALFCDLKGIWRDRDFDPEYGYWCL